MALTAKIGKSYAEESGKIMKDIYKCNPGCTDDCTSDWTRFDPVRCSLQCECEMPFRIRGEKDLFQFNKHISIKKHLKINDLVQMTTVPAATEGAPAPAKAEEGGNTTLYVIIGVVVVVLIGAGAGFFFYKKKNDETKEGGDLYTRFHEV